MFMMKPTTKKNLSMKEMMDKTAHLDEQFDKDFPDRDLDKEKQDFINRIKQIKKEQIFEVKKYTLWQKIKKTLGL